MAARICFVLALIAVTSADPDCAETGTCAEDVHEVSLLQTDIKVKPSKIAQAAVHKHVQANVQASDAVSKASVKKEATGVAPTSGDAVMGVGLVATLLVVGVVLNLQVPALKLKSGSDSPKYLAEFLGTWMLVFSVGCNVLVGDATWAVTSIACTLMVSIYAMGSVSGAHFNPAVSVACGLSGKIEWPQAAVYICVQLAAGVCAALSYGCMLGKSFNLEPKPGHSIFTAGVAELLYTFMLTFVVLNVACTKAANQYFGLAIGFTVIAGGYGAGSISGGCFNPAIAFGVDASTISQGFGNCISYIAFEIIGCAIAAAMFRICRPDEVGEEVPENPQTRNLLSEFLGTFMLVLTVCLNVLNKSPAGAFSIAASLMCMIFALGDVSGAHFNPAVTLALLFSPKKLIVSSDALKFMVAQISGGLCAATTASMLMGGATVPLGPLAGVEARQALVGEFIFTFLLCFVVLCVATVEKPLTEYFGLAIGACVIVGGCAIGGLSGGSLNPAVSAALAGTSAYKGFPLTHLVPYVAVEMSGGLVAALLFSKIHVNESSEKA